MTESHDDDARCTPVWLVSSSRHNIAQSQQEKELAKHNGFFFGLVSQ